MSGTSGARRSNTPRKAAGTTKKAARSPRAAKTAKSQQPATKRAPRKKPPPAPIGPPLASELIESPRKALDRLLGTIVLTPSIAVTAANARAIADVIPYAEPGDRPKMTRELSRLQAELIAAGSPSGEPPDWTQTTAGVTE